MFDVDNDGDLDIHVTNGHVIDNVKLYQPNLSYAQKDLLYENLGGTVPRRLGAERAGAPGRARRPRPGGRGLRQRRQPRRRHLERRTAAGPAEESGTGQRQLDHHPRPGHARATASAWAPRCGCRPRTDVQVREINNVASYLSANDIRLHVGLGARRSFSRSTCCWPSGTKQTLKDVAVNQILVDQGTVTAHLTLRTSVLVVCAAHRARCGRRIAATVRRRAPSPRAKTPTAPTTSASRAWSSSTSRRPRRLFAERSRSIHAWRSHV